MVHWVHARAVINDTPFPARAVIAEIGITRQRNDCRKTGNPQEHAATTSKCTIPFGHPPQPETTRIAETHCITSKRHLDRPNGTWDPQGDALSIHKFSRIHHELAINIHFPFFALSFSIQHSAFSIQHYKTKGTATGHALILRQQCTLYILHCTLKKGQNRLASYRRPSGF